MRAFSLFLFIAVLCLPATGRAQSDTPPPPDAKEPAKPPFNVDSFAYWAADAGTEKGAWIGLSLSPAAPALRHQLKLAEGTGLVVDFVQPKSPADEAGIKQYDVLLRLDEQILINAEQFAVLVRTFKPGDQVTLSIIREGDRTRVPVKLIEHELPKLSLDASGQFAPSVTLPSPTPQPPYQNVTINPPAAAQIGEQRIVSYVDGPRELSVVAGGGHVSLVVLEHPSGKVLSQYHLDTREQFRALPKELRTELEKMKFLPPAENARVGSRPVKPGSSSEDKKDAEDKPEPAAK